MVGRKGRRFLSLPVVAVIALMGFVHYFTVYVFIEDWLSLGSSAGFYNALVFSFLALMSLASFFAAVLVDPGHVPASFVPDTEGSQGNVRGARIVPKMTSGNVDSFQKYMFLGGVRLKYCDRCCSYKPPRSHHCRVCRMCVLKMDHHCLWINNCVGYANYKPFVIFVLYASSSSIYSMVMFVCSTLQNDHKFIGRASLEYFHVAYGSIIIILSMLLGTLLGWHIYLLSRNMTTIEYREGVRAMWLARKSGQSYHHLFDRGMHKNLTSILGPNVLKWFCPLALGHLRDGTQFPIYQE